VGAHLAAEEAARVPFVTRCRLGISLVTTANVAGLDTALGDLKVGAGRAGTRYWREVGLDTQKILIWCFRPQGPGSSSQPPCGG